MKKAIFTIVLALASVALSAQTFSSKTTSGGGFDADSGVLTTETFIVDGQSYPVYETEGGSKYMKLKSARTGNSYAVWIGAPTEYMFEGRTVYQSKSGSYCVYVLSANSGNPYPKWLEKN